MGAHIEHRYVDTTVMGMMWQAFVPPQHYHDFNFSTEVGLGQWCVACRRAATWRQGRGGLWEGKGCAQFSALCTALKQSSPFAHLRLLEAVTSTS